jgi:5-methylcytosine-specific restriction endonuclease McrA
MESIPKRIIRTTTRHTWEQVSLERARRYGVRIEPVSRLNIINRDGYICYLCKRQIGKRELVLDHVIPLARGGPHSEDNLRVACRFCNARKGDKLVAECAWLKVSDGTLTIRIR